jgi:hypothetical protein
MAKRPTYSTQQRDVAVHIDDDPLLSWVAVDGHGIKASAVRIISDVNGPRYSKLVIEVPMHCVEVVTRGMEGS